MELRTCTKCNKEFDSSLIKDKRRKSRCKSCHNLYLKEYRRNKNPQLLEKEELAKQGKKRCTKCSNVFSFDKFHKYKQGYMGLRSECNSCTALYDKELQLKTQTRTIRDSTFKAKEYRKQYRQNNIDNARKYEREWRKEKRKDPFYKIKMNLSSRISNIIKNKTSRIRTLELLGCTREEFIAYIESKFTEGMNWNNYGKKGWTIDHIIPVSSFNLEDENELRICSYYTNLQPLWWYDNLLKSNKII